MKNRDVGIVARVVLLYLSFSATWILVSDHVVELFASSAVEMAHFQTFKGLLFVVASALVVFLLLRRELNGRRRAELSYRVSEARYRSVFENSLDALLLSVPDGRILAANPAACRLFGRSETEICEIGRDGLLVSDDPRLGPLLEQRSATGKAFGTVSMLRADGTRFEGEISSALFETPEGARTSMIVRDITERKRVEEELLRAKASLEQAEELAGMGSWEIEVRTGRLRWSRNMFSLLGFQPSEEPPSPGVFEQRVRPEDRPRIAEARAAMTKGIEPVTREFRSNPELGSERCYRSTWSCDRDASGEPQRFLGTLLDITRRRQAEAELERHRWHLEDQVRERTAELAAAKERAESADRLKSSFLATMSHELRTPLNSVIGFTGILLQEIPGKLNAEQQKQLRMVLGSARHLLALVNDVLDISKIEAGQLQVDQDAFDVPQTIKSIVSVIECSARDKGLALRVEIASDVGKAIGDRRRYEQVLLNLLSNAVKFTDSGAIVVKAQRTDDAMVEATVHDTGIGLTAGAQAALFQPFFQVENGTSRKYGGTGLGLSISRRLVELMGGKLWVQSAIGAGSTFGYSVPLQGRRGGEK